MSYGALANLILVLHIAFMLFILLGQVLILLGACLRWQWVRNPWFRWLHLLSMGFVVVQAVFGVMCPLTMWEYDLRDLDLQDTETLQDGEWIPQIPYPLFVLRRLFFFSGSSPAKMLPYYIAFVLMVVVSFVLAPPRWRRKASPSVRGTVLVTEAPAVRQSPQPVQVGTQKSEGLPRGHDGVVAMPAQLDVNSPRVVDLP